MHRNVDEIITQIEDFIKEGLKEIVLLNMTSYIDNTRAASSNKSLQKVIEYFHDVSK